MEVIKCQSINVDATQEGAQVHVKRTTILSLAGESACKQRTPRLKLARAFSFIQNTKQKANEEHFQLGEGL